MPAKTRKSTRAATAAAAESSSSVDHLHPSSAAASPSKSKHSTSSSSSTTSTINGESASTTHVPLKTSSSSTPASYQDPFAQKPTWNPIKIIERKLFRAYWNVEATFVLSMLEAWEVFLVIVVFVVLTALVWYSLIYYFPRHIQQVSTRALYYVYGNHPPPQLAAAVTSGVNVTDTLANVASSASGAVGTGGEGVLEKLIASSNQLWASLDAEKALGKNGDPELVDRLISNLNRVKEMIADAAVNTGNAVKGEL